MDNLNNSSSIPEMFWILLGIGLMVLLCCAGRAIIIHEKGKITGGEAGNDETE